MLKAERFVGILILQNSTVSYLPATNKFILTLPVWVELTASVNSFFLFLDLSVLKLLFPMEGFTGQTISFSAPCCSVFTHSAMLLFLTWFSQLELATFPSQFLFSGVETARSNTENAFHFLMDGYNLTTTTCSLPTVLLEYNRLVTV